MKGDDQVPRRSTSSMATGRGRENDAMGKKARSGMGSLGKDVSGKFQSVKKVKERS